MRNEVAPPEQGGSKTRKIVAGEFVSLDGVIEAPEELTSKYGGPEFREFMSAGMAESDALLLGRVTYEGFIPFFADRTEDDDPVAVHMSKPKFVVSNTLKDVNAWKDCTLVRGDVFGQLRELKQRPGRTILTIGSATLVRYLLEQGLLDELRLLIFPVVRGAGKRLFEGSEQLALKVKESETWSGGVLSVTYEPATGGAAVL
jgi:dihydrofolate reductase